jgi:hypothetical protein
MRVYEVENCECVTCQERKREIAGSAIPLVSVDSVTGENAHGNVDARNTAGLQGPSMWRPSDGDTGGSATEASPLVDNLRELIRQLGVARLDEPDLNLMLHSEDEVRAHDRGYRAGWNACRRNVIRLVEEIIAGKRPHLPGVKPDGV